MADNFTTYAALADETAKRITSSFGEWTAFLETAGRLYKYPFHEQLMIYAQRPDATACAGYDVWNGKMQRYIRRGSKGIALIDTDSSAPRIKYVFDVSDTGGRDNSRRPFLWEYREEHHSVVSAALETKYDVPTGRTLPDKLEAAATKLVAEYWEENHRDICGILANSFLEEYDIDSAGAVFREAATVSTTYMLMSRCGLKVNEYYAHEDFLSVFDFNTRETVAALGTAVSTAGEHILRSIEVTIKNYEREHIAERSKEDERSDIHQDRGLHDAGGSGEREQVDDTRKVREDEKSVSEGAPPDPVEQPDTVGEAVQLSSGDRQDSERENGADDIGADETERRDGGTESHRSVTVDGTYEQPQSDSGGNGNDGAHIQLNDGPTPFQSVRGEQLTLFDSFDIPSEAEQIEEISQAESVKSTPFAFHYAQSVIDTILIHGSNTDNSRMRIVAEFMKPKSDEEHGVFLKKLYHGGNGYKLDGRDYAAWYAEDGIHIASGRSSKYIRSAQVVTWTDAASRIGEMLREGSFATNVELAEAMGYECDRLAEWLVFLQRDISEEVQDEYFAKAMFEGSYEDSFERVADMLENPLMRDSVVAELERFADDYRIDRSILRMHYHKVDEHLTDFRELSAMTVEYSTDVAEIPAPDQFITEDEIDATFTRGSGVDGGKMRIYEYFTESRNAKEKVDFLKREYGIGGHSHAVSGSNGSWEEHGGKGILLKKDGCANVEINWANAVKRLDSLISKDRYLNETEKNALYSLKSAATVYNDIKHDHPDDIVLYQVGDFFEMYGEDAKAVAEKLELYTTTRNIPDVGRVDMCGIPAHKLSEYTDKLHGEYDVTVAAYDGDSGKHNVYTIAKLQDEAEVTEVVPPRTEPTQDEIDTALCEWNGDNESKLRVIEYMRDHGREKDTAKWLSREYGGKVDAPLHITVTGTDIDVELPWTNVQRCIAQLIGEGKFTAEVEQPQYTTETVAVYDAEKTNLPYDIEIQTIRTSEPEHTPPTPAETEPDVDEIIDEHPVSIQIGGEWRTFPNTAAAEEAAYEEHKTQIRANAKNFRITDDALGIGGPKAKYQANIAAIKLLKHLESDGSQALPEQQEVLSRYVGWGGIAEAFDETKANWKNEYTELKSLLTPEEYEAARASTLNAHYTSPTVIKAMYEAIGNMGFKSGNMLEPSMGVGNFFGLLPESMSESRLYGVELDSITGRIAKQLYPKADITVAGFETTDRRDFYDVAIGNVPFGQYKVNDKAYNKLGFSIHDYFFAKAIDQVRPGGVIAFVTSRYTMDKESPEVRRYIAERAELLGSIRLPNNAFKANAGTDVVSDILFLQKRDRPITIEPDWVHLGKNDDGFAINSYFIDHPEMILGRQSFHSTQYGRQDFTVEPIEGLELADQLRDAVKYIRGTYTEAELPELVEGEEIGASIPANPDVKNYSYTVVDGDVYYRENAIMVKPNLNATAAERVRGMVELRDCVQGLIDLQLNGGTDGEISRSQAELNRLYDSYTAKFGLINDRANRLAFSDDSSYYLLCSLEILDEEHNLKRKADMFTKRTIKQSVVATSVDTAAEALALSISEKASVDMAYMSSLTGKSTSELADELRGVIFRLPEPVRGDGEARYVTADEYLSGNVREKLRLAEAFAADNDEYLVNVEALRAAQPKELDASEIEVRLGATWIDKSYIKQFMLELLNPSYYARRRIEVNYSEFTAEWNISGKTVDSSNINAYYTYGTDRANAYKILEDTLNLRDVRIYDTVIEADGKERRVLNAKETTLAGQKQQAIKDAFRDWIWADPERRHELTGKYNELFNSTRPREFNGEHISFIGMNPEITLREHQKNAVAHILYGGNTLLAHEVGAGKTFEMIAAAMESKRLGLCNKPLFAVPNHLTEQWASEFLRLYPSANILVTTKKDFEPANRKKFCARIATGSYDAVIMGHSQFEKIPMSRERQEKLLREQIEEITDGIEELKESNAERFTVKELERTRKSLQARLEKLQASDRKDDVVTFEQLGVDRLYVDEAHNYKNLFLYTKMRNVAGLSTTDAQKSSDMFMKCRYLDEITGSRGVVFATGTPVSNSMTELYTMMRYLQHDMLERKHLTHFDAWASTFGETTTAIELAPEGTGYRAITRFAKFFNLPELMNLFKEAADIKTSDQLHLPVPEAEFHTVVAKPTEVQKKLVEELSERASKVHAGIVDPSVDNMLKITSDGRKLGLDQRIINPAFADDPTSKVNLCVDNIFEIWEETKADRLTQLVFSDLSTPQSKAARSKAAEDKAASSADIDAAVHGIVEAIDKEVPEEVPFNVYDDIREKLVARGVPREEVAFIHEADTEAKKEELFSKVRSGRVRILIGSTAKMGAGTNCQERLIALHDLDCPWRPGDLEQRKGRIVRQGNMNKTVRIYRYVTEATFDAYLWVRHEVA